MPQGLVLPIFKTAVASAAYTATATTANFALPGVSDSYMIIINNATVTGTSPTMDAVLQTSVDGGTTYVNLPIRSTQMTAAGESVMGFRLGLGPSDAAFESPAASTGGTLAKNCIFDPSHMKIKFTIGGTNPSFTTTVYAAAVPLGTWMT